MTCRAELWSLLLAGNTHRCAIIAPQRAGQPCDLGCKNVKDGRGERQDVRRRLERQRGGAERYGRRDDLIVCVKEMLMCQTIEKIPILKPQISNFRLRRAADGPPPSSTLNSQKWCTLVQTGPRSPCSSARPSNARTRARLDLPEGAPKR